MIDEAAAELIARVDVDEPRIVLGARLTHCEQLLEQLEAWDYGTPSGLADAVVTDAGSVKSCVVEDVRRVFGKLPANFVPGHPIAGTEKSGVDASFAELFREHKVIVTPLRETADEALQFR